MSKWEKAAASVGKFLDRFGIRRYHRWEFDLMRVAFAVLVFYTFPSEKHLYATQDNPNGIAQWFDLTFLANPDVYRPLEIIGYVCLVVYAIGILPVIPLGYLVWFSIVTRTLANSQGGISHSYQMVTMILVAQFIIAAIAFFRPLIKEGKFRLFQSSYWDNRAIYYSQLAMAGAYVIAAITKLKNSGLMWFWNSPYFVTDVIKTNRQNYYAKLDDERFLKYGEEVPYVQLISDYPMFARILFAPGILFEIGAVLALLGRKWALAVGLLLVSLHLGIKEVMKLDFLKNEICVAIFMINIPFWIYFAFRKFSGKKVELA